MKKKPDRGMKKIILGIVILLSVGGLWIYNDWEDRSVQKTIDQVIPQMMEEIVPNSNKEEKKDTLEIDGNEYIGCLSVPKLELELPILAEWSDQNLKIAPCRYVGSVQENNLVLLGHNYKRHFGRLSRLKAGDTLTFTDVNGTVTEYEVKVQKTVAADAVEEITAGEYDLVLFTCNYDGNRRIAIECMQTQK